MACSGPELRAWLIARVAATVRADPAAIDPREPLATYGLGSADAVALAGALEELLGRPLDPTLVYEHPTIDALADHLTGDTATPSAASGADVPGQAAPIAIVGIGCRFPGAPDARAFWRLLTDAVDATGPPPRGRDPGPRGGWLPAIDGFDAAFFGIAPREASCVDPQQRLLLEVAWEALEDAGLPPDRLAGTATGVFVGISTLDYLLGVADPEAVDGYLLTGNAHAIAANRISYALGLRGPSLAVDTACSSSLVAVHLACQSLRNGESTVALAGGVNLIASPWTGASYRQAGALAADGRCKAFAAGADGVARGEGAGVVVLKPLARALAAGDRVYAVVLGGAVNCDGRTNGLTAPSPTAQEALLREAYRRAGVAPADVQYVEAHGTGTPLGDPIEARALGTVLGAGRAPDRALALGSAKTNLAHLEAAAGIASLIKTALALRHRVLPASLHGDVPSPHIPFAALGLTLQRATTAWPAPPDVPAIAGVSAFGFGGTNAHLVLAEPPPARPPRADDGRTHLVPLSARTPEGLRAAADALRAEVAGPDPTPTLADVAWTAGARRSHHRHRLAIAADSRPALAARLGAWLAGDPPPGATVDHVRPARAHSLVFVFSGHESQWAGMGRQLAAEEPAFAAALAACERAIAAETGWAVTDVLADPDPARLAAIDVAQPTIFAVQVALAALWRAWGLEPAAVVGVSLGEVAAAHVAGAIDLRTAARIVCHRSRLGAALAGRGAMAMVSLSSDATRAALAGVEDRVALAVEQGPDATIVAGEPAALEALLADLRAARVFTRALAVPAAGHCPQLDPLLPEFLAALGTIAPAAPEVPLWSTVTGTRAERPIHDAAYWAQNARATVRFWTVVQRLVAAGHDTFLEVSPHPVLFTALDAGLRRLRADGVVGWSLRRGTPERPALQETLARFWTRGYPLDWARLHHGGGRTVSLPPYPWQRERFWVRRAERVGGAALPARRDDHPRLLGPHLRSAVPPHAHHWETTVEAGVRLDDRATIAAVALAAAGQAGLDGATVGDVTIGPAASDGDARVVQVVLVPDGTRGATLSVLSRPTDGDGTGWTTHATARLVPASPPAHADAVQPERGGDATPSDRDTIAATRAAFRALPSPERAAAAVAFVGEQIARVTGTAPPADDQLLDELGLDSLTAVELRNRVEHRFGVTLPFTRLLEGPTLAELGAEIATAADAPVLPAIVGSEPGDGPRPTSPGQRALWFIDRLAPGHAAYNVARALRVRDLDVDALRRTAGRLLVRHPQLRATFTAPDGVPVCRVGEVATGWFVEEDASTWTEDTLAARLAAEAERPFDLATGSLVRWLVLARRPHEHVVLLAAHHIVADLWSLEILLREFATLYPAERAGALAALPPPAVDYADWVRWQEALLDGPEGERLWTYWGERLAGPLPPLALPTDRPRPRVQQLRAARTARTFDPALEVGLRALAARHGTTLYATLLAAFQALLARWSGQDDVLVASPTAGRSDPALADVVGYFVNPVVLRGDLSGRPTFTELLGRTREAVLGATAHQALPFPLLVERLQPGWDPGRAPICQAWFILQQAHAEAAVAEFALATPGDAVTAAGLDAVPLPLARRHVPFELLLMMAPRPGGGLHAVLEWDADLWDDATMARFLEQLERLLASVVADPGQRCTAVPLLATAERQRAIVEWNATARPYPADTTIHARVAVQAARAPKAIAVEDGTARLSYAALEARANGLAARLRRHGVGPDTPVGVGLDRSLDGVIATLAVLKAGGAYVPLDPAAPSGRLAALCTDVGTRVIIGRPDLRDRLPADIALVDVADGVPDATVPPATAGPDHLAYVMYTSGSTGQPKGIGIPHRAVLRLVCGTDYVALGPHDVVAHAATPSFDASTFELWGALANGARLVIVPRDVALAPAVLGPFLRARGVTTLFLTTALLHQTAREAPAALAGLRQVVFGGEAADPSALRAILAAGAPARLVNGYGPTETTTFASWHLVTAVADDATTVPIGRPIANTTLHVLDSEGEPAPVGVVGELYVGGPGLARGYVGRPALTAERFVPDPFVPGARLYRTGDLGRRTADGTVVFVGRTDGQLKLRGHRIEPGEVEHALARHPDVAASVIDVRALNADRRLVAWVVGRNGAAPDPATLRTHLRAVLPEWMVPAAFVSVQTLPLGPTGKVDRRALPDPEASARGLAAPGTAPRTSLEAQLVEIFAGTLGVADVGVEDSFFDLGGHSLLATQVVSRIRDACGVELPLRAIFEAPTVAALAGRVESAHATATPALVPRPPEDPPVLSLAQQRCWLLHRLDPESPVANVPLALRLEGTLDLRALGRALDALVARHEALRTTITIVDGVPVATVAPSAPVALPVDDLASVPAAEREAEALRCATAEARKPFTLEVAPLVRARVLRLDARTHVLVFTLHHAACDGWSLGVLARELGVLYAAAATGTPDEMPPLPIRYTDFAAWQQARLAAGQLDADLAYWRETLAGVTPVALPTDRPRPALPTGRGALVPVRLDASLAGAVSSLARRLEATPFMVFVAAFQSLLGRLAATDDVALATPVANRTRAETEGVVGLFVNNVVLRTRLDGDPTFAALVARTRETALGAYAHQDVPFEVVADTVRGDDSDRPDVSVMFALQNTPFPHLALGDLVLRPLPLDTGAAKLDLTLSLWPDGDAFAGTVEYATDLFDAATVARWADAFVRLLQAVTAAPDTPVSSLALVSPADAAWLDAVNDTAAPLAAASAHALIAAAAARTPDAIAVEDVSRQLSLTYAALETRADALAHRLRALGVRPEVPVALFLDRSPEFVIAALAVLKAGGAFVPLDPGYPRARLALVLDDAQPPVIVTDTAHAPGLPPTTARLLHLDVDHAATAAGPGEPVAGDVRPDHLAYIIYTSGSTGRPKGVLLTHRGLVNLISAQGTAFGICRGTRVLQFAALGFDATVSEVFVTLGAGGTLVLAAADALVPGPELVATLRDARIDAVTLSPSVLAALPPDDFPRLATVIAAGEACPADVVARWGPGRRFIDAYGPTEITVCATLGECVADERAPSIGHPLANTVCRVLDRHGLPVPPGVPGELYIGGAGLARGYLGRPDLTSAAFVPDPFANTEGARLYRSGDRVRWRDDGTLEFLGRVDAQVKLHGFRIEPGEVVAALRRLPAIRDAAVATRPDRAGENRLVAWVVARDGAAIAAEAVRADLASELPAFMVPSAVVPVDTLPRTANGKLDVQALPAPTYGPSAPWRAPATLLEMRCAAVFEEVLGRAGIGADDDFFALGGQSLSAARIAFRLGEVLARAVPFRLVFAARTPAALAVALAAKADPVPLPDLLADARLDPAIAVTHETGTRPGDAFLTGATGFLGAFLLVELLHAGTPRVHCLVRAPDAEAGMLRLREALARYDLWDPALAPRIVAIPGDLARPGLGLAPEAFASLGRAVGAVYHAGAEVSAVAPYAALRPTNVDGTREVIRLAALAGRPLHHVSTLSVVPSGRPVAYDERTPLDDATALEGGYAQSKWVAERLVLAAGARGLPVTVHRPAHITGHSGSGAGPIADAILPGALRACLAVGAVPDVHVPVDLTPVDYVSRAVVFLAAQPRSIGRLFHLANRRPVDLQRLAGLVRRHGYRLRRLPWAQWRAALAELDPTLATLLPPPDVTPPVLPRLPFDCRRTRRALAGSGIVCPPVNARLIGRYLAYLGAAGVIPPPRVSGRAGRHRVHRPRARQVAAEIAPEG